MHSVEMNEGKSSTFKLPGVCEVRFEFTRRSGPSAQQRSDSHDGTIASVYFDFAFVIDGKPENQGRETWQLVKASDGWKIVAITYSSNPNAAA